MGNPSAILSEKWANGSEVGAGGCCPTPDCCAMRAERLGAALGVLWTEPLSELEEELLPLSLSSPSSLSTISPSSRPPWAEAGLGGAGLLGGAITETLGLKPFGSPAALRIAEVPCIIATSNDARSSRQKHAVRS